MIRSGQLVMQRFRKDDYEIFKKDGGSIVTTVDFENEQFLKSELAKIVEQAGFIAEESLLPVGDQPDFMWVIDPLDGTKNFVKGIPHFCIMVALTYKDEPIAAAIYQPVTQELYYAEKGKGLWLHGSKIEFADRLKKNKTAIAVCSQVEMQELILKLKKTNIQISRRYFGSAGIDAIYLAVENIDFVILKDVAWWDVAAGMLLIREAGGRVCLYEKSLTKNSFGTLKAGNKLFF